jgi:hypothetical protein
MVKSMHWRARAAETLFAVARTSQALVVHGADRTFAMVPGAVVPRGMVRRVAPVLDDGYDVTIRLLELHRQFTQRLADAMRADIVEEYRDASDADLISLAAARRRRSTG